jgi:hypothetical protein
VQLHVTIVNKVTIYTQLMPIAPRGISILLTFMFAHNGPVDEPPETAATRLTLPDYQ